MKGKTLGLNAWRTYLLLAAVQGGIALALLLQTPSEPGQGIFFGFSPLRLAMMVGVLAGVFFFGWFLVKSWRNRVWFKRVFDRLSAWLVRRAVWGKMTSITLLLMAVGIYLAMLTPEVTEPFTRVYFDRLLPLIYWIVGLSFQSLIVLLFLQYGFDIKRIWTSGRILILFLISIGLFSILLGWVSRTQLKTESQVLGWNDTGVPILETQILIAWIIVILTVVFVSFIRRGLRNNRLAEFSSRIRLDVILGSVIWLSAVLLWSNIPITPNWFASEHRPPNYETYPNSDASFYDMTAQLLLVGEKLQFQGTPFVRRPMHALYLTALHVIGGQNYETIVLMQVMVLAILPVLIFFLTKALSNRLAGLLAAIFIIFREANSIAIAGTITASHAKLLMVDLPATLVIVAYIILLVGWLKGVEEKRLYPLFAGGILGIGILIRIELGALLIPTVLMIALVLWKRRLDLFKGIALLLLGLILILSPWIWRNYNLTGRIFIDSPSFRAEDILTHYEKPESAAVPSPLEETEDQLVQPTPESTQPQSVTPSPTSQLLSYLRNNVPEVTRFAVSHYMNSQVQVLLVLPTSVRVFDSLVGFLGHKEPDKFWYECCSILSYVRRLPYWHKWDGEFPSQAILPFIGNFFLIILGIGFAWRKDKLISLVPLFLTASHLLVYAVIRKSGGRYIQPADWVGVMYYSIGLAQVTVLGILAVLNTRLTDHPFLQDNPVSTRVEPRNSLLRSPWFYTAAMGIFLLGSTLPLLEQSIQPRYTDSVKAEMMNTLIESEILSDADRRLLKTTLQEGGVVSVGRGLFPRYYRSEEGEPGTRNPLGPLPYPRLGFYLAGPDNRAIILPLNNRPGYFPNAADVLVLARPDGEVVTVSVFKSLKEPEAIYFRSPSLTPNSH
ncbi:MAG: hypothetical protein A2Z45_08640 [Chloroflexi bacterium RBG_19FT_COMBO_55_16]|nr:MAG: hypothetical protein A2Z45_08640 [Chloroflexi bacterium RBG_19FT_COMBO_55_16]